MVYCHVASTCTWNLDDVAYIIYIHTYILTHKVNICIQSLTSHKAGHRSTLASLRLCVIAATGRRKHTQFELLWITRRIRRISAFPINSERLDASVFTSMLPEIGRKSRTCATRATDVIFEHKHCSRRRSHTQVEITSPQKRQLEDNHT